MEINISNLGTIKEGKLELGKLTILGGKNNSGKTYVAYSIYGFIEFFNNYAPKFLNTSYISIDELKQKGFIEVEFEIDETNAKYFFDKVSRKYSEEGLANVFNSNKSLFSHSNLDFKVSDYELHETLKLSSKVIIGNSAFEIKKVKDDRKISFTLTNKDSFDFPYHVLQDSIQKTLLLAFFYDYIGEAHIITSERTGVQMFQKELDSYRNTILEEIINGKESKDKLKFKTARYSLPIRDNISQVRDLSEAYKQTSFLVEKNPKFELGAERVSGVKFNVDENGRITIASKEGEEKFAIDLHLASSSSRALLGLHTYIKHLAKENELLIID